MIMKDTFLAQLGSGEVLPSLGVRRPSVVRPLTFHILIYYSETTGPNGCSIFSNSGHVCWPNGTK
jgi:hypothetical protein